MLFNEAACLKRLKYFVLLISADLTMNSAAQIWESWINKAA